MTCMPFPDGKLCSDPECTWGGAYDTHWCTELAREIVRWRSPTWEKRVQRRLGEDGYRREPRTVDDLRGAWDSLSRRGAIDPAGHDGWHHALAHLRYERARAAAADVGYGRCRSGGRWFWFAAATSWDQARGHCADPVCGYGWTGHEHGWADGEQAAITALSEAVLRFGGTDPRWNKAPDAFARGAGGAAAALKRINSARRKARSSSGTGAAGVVEYLYSPDSWTSDYDGHTEKRMNVIAITKRTAKRVYFDVGDGWDRDDGVVSLGYIDRAELEDDTRCPGAAAGRPKCEHGYYSSHGYPPGEMWYHGSARGVGHLFATREAAEEYLYGRERERARRRDELEPDVKRLRQQMADAHPDRGGTDAGFIEARERYQRALREVS
jgi:hypothetical protein